jgi:hypothetical protein
MGLDLVNVMPAKRTLDRLGVRQRRPRAAGSMRGSSTHVLCIGGRRQASAAALNRRLDRRELRCQRHLAGRQRRIAATPLNHPVLTGPEFEDRPKLIYTSCHHDG